MSHFREVLQCRKCGKIYRSSYFPELYSRHIVGSICGKCGARNKLKYVIGKPILFGLKGWEIKGDKE